MTRTYCSNPHLMRLKCTTAPRCLKVPGPYNRRPCYDLMKSPFYHNINDIPLALFTTLSILRLLVVHFLILLYPRDDWLPLYPKSQ